MVSQWHPKNIWLWRFLLSNKVSLRLLFFPCVNLWLGCGILYPTLNANVSCLQDLHFCFFGCLPCISGFTRAMIITNNDDDELMIDIMSSKNCLHFSFTSFLCPTKCWTYMERLGDQWANDEHEVIRWHLLSRVCTIQQFLTLNDPMTPFKSEK